MSKDSGWKPKVVNSCVYCGARKNLTSEHVIPYSLGGLLELQNGSCLSCAEITSKFERTVARAMLGNFRVKFGAPTRRKRDRPSTLVLEVINGLSEAKHNLSPKDHPGAICLPGFSPPRVLTGSVGVDNNLHQPMSIWTWPAPEYFHTVLPKNLPDGSAVKMATLQINAFVRLLAKMAHCNSLALYGEGVFRPLLIPLILGQTNEYSNYIGGSSRSRLDISNPVVVEATVRKNYGTWFLVNTIYLFPQLRGPSYDVIVGTCVDQSESIGLKMPGSGLL